jgi:putative transposase
MSHTYVCLRFHVIFSTAQRRPFIDPKLESELWKYIGGVARNYGMKAHEVGGVEDHVHILLAIPPTISLAKGVQVIKANSSRWMKEKGRREFAWQQGYAAATVSLSIHEKVVAYIRNQREHHARQSSRAEFDAFLRRHLLNPMPSLRDSNH